MNKNINTDYLQEKFDHILTKMDNNHSVILEKVLHVYDQAKKTNGRVTKLESETYIIRTMAKYPKLFSLTVLGVITAVNLGLTKLLV